MQRSEKNLKYQSLGYIGFHLFINLLLLYLIFNVFLIRRPNLPVACNLRWVGSLVSPKELLVSASLVLGLEVYSMTPVFYVDSGDQIHVF